MEASCGSTRLRVLARRSIFSERAAVLLTAAEVSTSSASSIVARRGGLVDLALEGRLSGAARGYLAVGIGSLCGSRQLGLSQLQRLDGLCQLHRRGVVAYPVGSVDKLSHCPGHVLTRSPEP